jgi:very-short-patch-repair endonuclease
MSAIEALFALHVRAAKLPEPQREYRFDPSRRWKFDFAWPNWHIAVECEGGIWTAGRHTRGSGFEADCEKYNAATAQGWRVLRFTSGMVKSGAAIATLIEAVRQAA